MPIQQVQGKQKIIPHLWFDKEAKEAAEFYVSIFSPFDSFDKAQDKSAQSKSKITSATVLHDTPSGDCDVMSFELAGQPFVAISAGPYFKTNPSISFMLNFDLSRDNNAKENLDTLWEKLSPGGTALMPLEEYPFSERYGWIQDKYGVSWQLMLSDPKGEGRPFIVPSLLFITDTCDKAEEATDFYMFVFKNAFSAGSISSGQARRGTLTRYPAGMEPNKEGAVMFTDFQLLGQWFAAMDGSSAMHNFSFNEAISFTVYCDTQAEIDYYWEKLSAVPESEQCGWLKDKYGLSWQIVPTVMDEMMIDKDEKRVARVTEAFLNMKKFDIVELQKAYNGT